MFKPWYYDGVTVWWGHLYHDAKAANSAAKQLRGLAAPPPSGAA